MFLLGSTRFCPLPQVCFFRQFFRSVPKVDYLTLRHGFIMVSARPIVEITPKPTISSDQPVDDGSQAHLAPHSNARFDFQKYINRSLEEDFKVVVGIKYAQAPDLFPVKCIEIWDPMLYVSFLLFLFPAR